ncbi:MAG: hypothetical protein ACI9MC_003776 [Kiritimatiellia bacterium]|jgi:hypothetical protein
MRLLLVLLVSASQHLHCSPVAVDERPLSNDQDGVGRTLEQIAVGVRHVRTAIFIRITPRPTGFLAFLCRPARRMDECPPKPLDTAPADGPEHLGPP